MNQAETLFIDTNIPMYAAGGEHPYKESSQQVLDRLFHGELRGATNAEVHQEILHRFLALRLPDIARDMSDRFQTLVPTVIPVTLQDIVRVRDLSLRYGSLPARDLVHVATMLNNGFRTIVSADRHFDQVVEIRRLDPTEAAGAVM